MPMTAASVIRSANNRLMPGLPGSNRDPLDLIEAHLAAPAVVQLRRARRPAVRRRRGSFEPFRHSSVKCCSIA